VRRPPKICDVAGCGRFSRSHKEAHCAMHRARAQRGTDLAAPPQKTPNAGLICAVDGCDRAAATKQLCKGHYGRLLRDGEPGPAEFFEPAFAPFVRDDGYVTSYANGRWDLQHRHVMEAVLGRRLIAGETPHHKNGQRDDNRPENLELWSKAQPAGQRISDKLAWCVEMVRQYPEMAAAFGLGFFKTSGVFVEQTSALVEYQTLGDK
jgi:HNH endonuclease